MKKWWILFLALTLGLMIVIFWFSSQDGEESKNISDKISTKIVTEEAAAKDGSVDWEKIASVAVRKTAHLTLYALLGGCAVLTLRFYNIRRPWKPHAAAALGFCLLYAVSDELHQTFIDGRAGRVLDVLIDCAGAALGIAAALYLITKTVQKA